MKIKQIQTYLDDLWNHMKQKYKRVLWEKSVKKACNDIGIISDSFAYNILTLNLIERCYLFSNDCTVYTLYYDFMITFCVELFDFFDIKFIFKLGNSILKNWFNYAQNIHLNINEQFAWEKLKDILYDREKLYQEYFKRYNNLRGKDTVRVRYPQNGQNWVEWVGNNYIDIKVDLEKGVDLGFCRMGCFYTLVRDDKKKILKVAYKKHYKEVLVFDSEYLDEIQKNNILWLY